MEHETAQSAEKSVCSSNEDISDKLRAFFLEWYVDQLEEECRCDVDEEVKRSYQFLLSKKEDSPLQVDVNIEDLKRILGFHGDECVNIHSDSNSKYEQIYELATWFLQKEINKNAQLTPSELRGDQTVVKTIKSMSNYSTGQTQSSQDQSDSIPVQENVCQQGVTNADIEILKTYPPARSNFLKTEQYFDIFETVQDKTNKVIHVHGMSGSGKSQIAIAICNELAKMRQVICHVQCIPDRNRIKDKWMDLIINLQNLGLVTVTESAKMKMTVESCDYDLRYFVYVLQKLSIPVFFVVEDVTDEKPLVESLLRQIVAPGNDKFNIQLIIVDQKMDALISQSEFNEMAGFVAKHVEGFTQKEAIEFLTVPNQNREKIAELAESLAYSPLRLFLARAYCLKFKESYARYFESLGTDSHIIAKEKEILSQYPGLKYHGCEVITRIVKPKDPSEEQMYRVLKMMSFLHNDNIPDLILGRFFQVVAGYDEREMTVDNERQQVMYLLEKLENDLNCSVRHLDVEYGHQLVSMHMDILHAVRLDMSEQEKSKVMAMVLQAFISFVGKENRLRTDSTLLFDMMGHMHHVTKFAERLLEAQFNLQKPELEHFEVQMGLCRLYDVLGFATTQHKQASKDAYFENAIDYCWNIACSYTEKTCFQLFNRNNNRNLKQMFHYNIDKCPQKTAKDACERLKKASTKIPEEFIVKICEKLFPVTLNLLRDMKVKLGGDCDIDWEEMEKSLKTTRRLSKKQCENLRKHGMLLEPKMLQGVYLAQYIASVLHSRGRQVLYLKDTISPEEQKRYEWYTDVGIHLCQISSRDIGKKSIFEYILLANNKLPRMLHTREEESDGNFWIRICNAREMAKQLRDEQDDFYEHGVYKLVSGTPYTVMNAMKYLVKANTKLHKRPLVAEQHPIPEALMECEALFRLSKENASKFVVASSCLVHVGKYYAAIKEYGKALEAFEFAFDYNGHGINSQLDKNPNIFAWVLYNVGRAMYAGGETILNGDNHKKKFMHRYQLVNKNNIGDLRGALDDVKCKLEHITFLSEMSNT